MEPIPLEALAKALEQILEQRLGKSSKESSETTNLGTYHIADITDQYVGESLIITGAPPPKKPLTPAEREGVTETSPENSEGFRQHIPTGEYRIALHRSFRP